MRSVLFVPLALDGAWGRVFIFLDDGMVMRMVLLLVGGGW